MPKVLTVAICTYNGGRRIPDVLDQLRCQRNVQGLEWEVLVVDNNSQDNTCSVVQQYQEDWPEDVPLRYLLEPRQGKTYAIQRAFRASDASLVGFLDDDNVPTEDWLFEACAFGLNHPEAGAYGGRILPMYEEQPSEGVEAIESAFAIVRRDYLHRYPLGGYLGRMFAPGAGLVIRKQAWFQSVPEVLRLEGPSGSSSMGLHEDMEVQWYLHKAGWEIWHNPAMTIRHKIPSRRFDEAYLMRFFQELAQSRYHYRMLIHAPWLRPAMVLLYLMSDVTKYFQTFSWGARQNGTVGARCRREMRKFLVISPFRTITRPLHRTEG